MPASNKPDAEKLVFAYCPDAQGDGVPMILIGVSPECWQYMSDGKTHTLDLTVIGVPFKMMMFGAASREAAVATVEEWNRRQGFRTERMPGVDFGMKPPGGRRQDG